LVATTVPTTDVPTYSPTTSAPVTNSPVTGSPSTSSPVTNSPTDINSQTTDSPTTYSQLTNSPTNKEKNTLSPTIATTPVPSVAEFDLMVLAYGGAGFILLLAILGLLLKRKKRQRVSSQLVILPYSSGNPGFEQTVKPVTLNVSSKTSSNKFRSIGSEIIQSFKKRFSKNLEFVDVLHDFTGDFSDELTVKANEELQVVSKHDEWWECRVIKTGEQGIIPTSFLKVSEAVII